MGAPSSRSCPRCGTRYDDASVEFCRRDGTRLSTGRTTPPPRRETPAGAPSTDAVDPLIGRTIAERFRVLEAIGRGGMGAVYLAEHLVMKRKVALKILRPELSSDPTAVARFEREAHAASRIESPHVVTLFDFGRSDDGLLYIAMEHLDGESLATRLDGAGALSVREAVDVATAIARALDAAHRSGVVHRDLKPDNVVIGRDRGIKVLDFGIARILEDDGADDPGAKLTQAGAIIGTPMYMSPEAAGRLPVGPPADLYALGVMLFEMLVGRPPFDDPQPVLLMGMHLRVPPELVSEARPEAEVPAALEELVDRLLAKEPEERPAGAGAVVEELERIAASVDLSGEVKGSPLPAPGARDARRRTHRGTHDERRAGVESASVVPVVPARQGTPPPASSVDPTPQPVVSSPARSRLPYVLGAALVAVAAVAVVGAYQAGREDRAAQPAMPPENAPDPAPGADDDHAASAAAPDSAAGAPGGSQASGTVALEAADAPLPVGAPDAGAAEEPEPDVGPSRVARAVGATKRVTARRPAAGSPSVPAPVSGPARGSVEDAFRDAPLPARRGRPR